MRQVEQAKKNGTRRKDETEESRQKLILQITKKTDTKRE